MDAAGACAGEATTSWVEVVARAATRSTLPGIGTGAVASPAVERATTRAIAAETRSVMIHRADEVLEARAHPALVAARPTAVAVAK